MLNVNLNKNQHIATNHNKGPMIVLSGPGSGKTTVITYRIKILIEKMNVLPRDILVITFTKAASEEMKNRFYSINRNHYDVTFGTFHSYFFKIIRSSYNYELNNILHDDEKSIIIKKIIKNFKVNFDNEEEFLQNIINEISFFKNELIDPICFNSNYVDSQTFLNIFNEYENIKNISEKIDFDDMLIKCYELLKNDDNLRKFWSNRYKYILIDEFQDINKVQYECVKMLISDEQNIFVVGDDDQSIYGFRGSSPEFLLNFDEDFKDVKKVILDINYRSTEEIIRLCNNIISDNKNRYKKDIKGIGKSYKAPILLRSYDVVEEAKKIVEKVQKFKKDIPLEEMAIIYRTNLQARAIIEVLMDYNIDYQIKDKIPSIYDHFIAKDIISYLKLCISNIDNDSFFKIANKPKRYLNKAILLDAIEHCKDKTSAIEYLYCHKDMKPWQIERINDLLFHITQMKNKTTYDAIKYILKNIGYEEYIEEYASFKKVSSKGLFEIANEILESSKGYDEVLDYISHVENVSFELENNFKKKKDTSGIVLTTMHSSKGLEFEVVFVIGCIEGIIPHEKSKSLSDIEEERRLFYVALTRAKRLIYISILKTRYESISEPSRFLKKLIKR